MSAARHKSSQNAAPSLPLEALQAAFGERMRVNESLARFTAARVGGPAGALLEADSKDELAEFVSRLWEMAIPFTILGGGSNVLISDTGVQGVVILNRARQVRFDERSEHPTIWAESGANFGGLARQAVARGLGGLEWATGIPGTLGGAVVGNAGAHGGDMAGNLLLAEILHHQEGADSHSSRQEEWTVQDFRYRYRESILKPSQRLVRNAAGSLSTISKPQPQVVILAALLRLQRLTNLETEALQERLGAINNHRRQTQPPGASMGSMFKNPPGDYAGRLIEAAGLKGAASGAAEISSLHANFFINRGQATAADIYRLICLAKNTVRERFGVELELEIELLGDWESVCDL